MFITKIKKRRIPKNIADGKGALCVFIFFFSSLGRTRTDMPLRAADFESAVSAISPPGHITPHNVGCHYFF